MNTTQTDRRIACDCGATRFHVEEVNVHIAQLFDGYLEITDTWRAEFIRFVCVTCKARFSEAELDTCRLCRRLDS